MPKHLKESPGIHLNLLSKTVSLKFQISAANFNIERNSRKAE
jgi:hypothetical protein